MRAIYLDPTLFKSIYFQPAGNYKGCLRWSFPLRSTRIYDVKLLDFYLFGKRLVNFSPNPRDPHPHTDVSQVSGFEPLNGPEVLRWGLLPETFLFLVLVCDSFMIPCSRTLESIPCTESVFNWCRWPRTETYLGLSVLFSVGLRYSSYLPFRRPLHFSAMYFKQKLHTIFVKYFTTRRNPTLYFI